MNVKANFKLAALVAIVATGFSAAADAQTLYWEGPSLSNWGDLTPWSTTPAGGDNPLAVPGATDTASFNITGFNTNQTVNLGGNQSALGLEFTSLGSVTLQGGGTNRVLSLGTGGISKTSATGTITIGSITAGQNVAISLTGSQNWTNNAATSGLITLPTSSAVSLANAGVQTLTLGGSNTAANLISSVISDGAGTLGLVKADAGSWTLSGLNTYSGGTAINGGTLIASANAIPGGAGKGNVSLTNSAILQFGGGQSINGLNGDAFTAVKASATSTLNFGGAGNSTFSGDFTSGSTLNLIKLGTGTAIINSQSGKASAGTLRVNGSRGTLQLDYSAMGTPTNLINSTSSIQITGGVLELKGKSGANTSQTFAGNLLVGSTGFATENEIRWTPNSATGLDLILTNAVGAQRSIGANLNLELGTAVVKTSGTGNFAPGTTNGLLNAFTTATASVPSAFATFNGNTWATVTGSGATSQITGLITSSYTDSSTLADAADYNALTGVASNVDVTTGPSPGFSNSITLDAPVTINTLRFNTAGPKTLSLSSSGSGVSVLNGGGILVTSAVGASPTLITGGKITGIAGGSSALQLGVTTTKDLIVHQHNTAGDLEINSEITNSGVGGATVTGLTKSGPGTLILSSTANSYTGNTIIGGGTLKMGTINALPSAPSGGGVFVTGILDLNGFDTTVNGMKVLHLGSITNDGAAPATLTFGDNNGEISFDNVPLHGHAAIVKDGASTLALKKTGTGTWAASSPVTYSGGTTIEAGPVTTLSTTESNLNVDGPLGLGVVNLNGGSLALANSTSLLNNTLNMGAGTLTFNTANNFTIGGLTGTGNIALGANALTIGANGSSPLVAYTGILSGTGSVTKIGDGTATFGNTNTYTGNTTVADGELVITGSQTSSPNYFVAQGANLISSLTFSGSALSAAGELRVGTNGGNGTFTQTAGAVTVGAELYVGSRDFGNSAIGTQGQYDVQAGASVTVTGQTNIGRDGGTGVINNAGTFINGGELRVGLNILGSGNTVMGSATFNNSGAGTVQTQDLEIATSNGALSTGLFVQDSSGDVNVTTEFAVGVRGTGTMTQQGAGSVIAGNGLGLAILADSSGTYNLESGTLDVTAGLGGIAAGLGTAQFNFSGGTLKTGSFNSNALGGDLGGLTQDGETSLLDVTGNSTTITGPYDLVSGTVDVGATRTLTVADGMTVGAGGTVNGNGSIIGDVINNGAFAPGNSVGALTVTGDLDFSGGGEFQWELGALTESGPGSFFDFITVSDELILGGSSELELDFSLLTAGDLPGSGNPFWDLSHSWKIIDTTNNAGTLFNSVAGQAGPGSWGVVLGIDGDAGDIFLTYTAVPEPGAVILVGTALAGLGMYRRRRV